MEHIVRIENIDNLVIALLSKPFYYARRHKPRKILANGLKRKITVSKIFNKKQK